MYVLVHCSCVVVVGRRFLYFSSVPCCIYVHVCGGGGCVFVCVWWSLYVCVSVCLFECVCVFESVRVSQYVILSVCVCMCVCGMYVWCVSLFVCV